MKFWDLKHRKFMEASIKVHQEGKSGNDGWISHAGSSPILTFYFIAVICRIVSVYVLPALFVDARQSIWLQLCEGVGPTLGALAVIYFFKKRMFCSIMGTSKLRSIACIVLPILIFFFFDKMNGAKASLVFLGCISYAFLEEVGWRGYLTGEFAGTSLLKRVLIVTAFWFFWHVNFPLGIGSLVFFAILLLASWGLDQLARDTHSLVLCACFHGIFNMFKHNNGLLDNWVTISLLAISIASWFIIWYFPFRKADSSEEVENKNN